MQTKILDPNSHPKTFFILKVVSRLSGLVQPAVGKHLPQREFDVAGQQNYSHRLTSSKGPNPLLPTFKHVYTCTLTCSLGCTFCTWHFTSSSSVKRKLKTVPEGQDLKQSFFFDSSCFLFTHNAIDEIP